ncbi:transporter substrate-binding domain-containing protein [Eubacteriales bacterium OttesenSCG-928-K08]|nr:transporter substrate-binding domain-containing protein [Eubacteriales bacterium OttesenSCG-928-K08]
MKKQNRIFAIVLALVLVLAMTACGKKQESAIDKIKAAGELTMLTNAAFAPFEYLGDDGSIAGVDVDIAKAVADELGVTLKVVDMDFEGIVMAVQSGQGDLGVAGMTNNEERRKSVDFSINYVSTTQVIIVQEGSDVKTADDLVGKQVGVQLGTTGDLFTSDLEGVEISRFKTGADAGMALSNGQISAVVIDQMPAQQIVASNTGLVVLDEPLTVEEYAIAIKKGNDDLKEVVDKVLQKLLDDGTVDKWIEEHMAAYAG